jgi:hypothetical protein
MSGIMFLCLLIGFVAALSEAWGVVIFCLIVGACTS